MALGSAGAVGLSAAAFFFAVVLISGRVCAMCHKSGFTLLISIVASGRRCALHCEPCNCAVLCCVLLSKSFDLANLERRRMPQTRPPLAAEAIDCVADDG